eukprot:NODE_75_length_23955_cov_0.435069.p11 type:complete len:266 gc:universal NODE_75_length_23955_cov_0.435069:7506-8303(+)
MKQSDDANQISVASVEKELFCGSIAGMVAKIVEHPLDTIKTRQQTTGHSISSISKSIFKEHWKSIYKGLSFPLFGAIIENASLFGMYEIGYKQTNNFYLAGGFAGFCTSFLLTPIELVKVKCQVNTLHYHNYDAFQVIKQIYKDKTWYNGHLATCVKETFGGMIWFGAYHAYISNKSKPTTLDYFLGGCIAGISYNLLLYPVDVIKSKRQATGMPLWNIVKATLSSRKKMFTGLTMSLMKSIPSSGCTFLVYEYVSAIYDTWNKS